VCESDAVTTATGSAALFLASSAARGTQISLYPLCNLLEQLQPLRSCGGLHIREPGNVAARTCQAPNKTLGDRFVDRREDASVSNSAMAAFAFSTSRIPQLESIRTSRPIIQPRWHRAHYHAAVVRFSRSAAAQSRSRRVPPLGETDGGPGLDCRTGPGTHARWFIWSKFAGNAVNRATGPDQQVAPTSVDFVPPINSAK
jgi:hypothetical protein